MKIGKKLYVGFGAVLLILVCLFIVNIFAGIRERSARTEASAALETVHTVESVRNLIMLNRLNLNNYLLSGDPRDEEKVNKGLVEIIDTIKRGEAQASADNLRNALLQVETTESNWADNFAKPLLAKRHQVDAGDATVSDLQIFYLQRDPGSWLAKSSTVLDRTTADITRSRDESTVSADRASIRQHYRHHRWNILCVDHGLADRLLYRQVHHRALDPSHYRGPRNRRLR